MGEHAWVRSTYGHGETMCEHCGITNREASALGLSNTCDKAPVVPEPDQARIAELEAALRTIAEFPFTDPKNMDAENMTAIARAALGGLIHD